MSLQAGCGDQGLTGVFPDAPHTIEGITGADLIKTRVSSAVSPRVGEIWGGKGEGCGRQREGGSG